MQPQNTFILRFWWEFGEVSQGPRWHGRIEHLQSGEGVSFKEAAQMLSFLQRYVPIQVDLVAGPAPSEDKPE